MEATGIAAILQEAVPGLDVQIAPTIDSQHTFYVDSQQLLPVLQALRDRPELKFGLLAELTAADFWPHREPRFELIYILVSVEHRLRVRVKARLPAEDPHVETASGLWPAANWLEREVWDLFGIAFDGHPDPRRLLMPEDWEGYPLRKDYPVQIQMKPEAGSPTQVTAEEFQANLMKDRLARK
jgi:NADH-quinone oxidoreductase subunit C